MITTQEYKGTYGIMPPKDYETMDTVLGIICTKFPSGIINTLEIGVHKGNGSRGIHRYFEAYGRINFHTGIDNGHDLPVEPPFPGCRLIIGNSNEVYNQIEDNSQHGILIDGNHSYPMTISDVFCYVKKVRQNGLLIMHDTGAQIKDFQDYQHMGSKDDRDMYISCRRAASDLGLLNDRAFINGCTLQKVLDVYDETFPTGGILALKRIM